MSTKHTPGPWETEDRRCLITEAPDDGSIGIYSGELWIADVHGAHVGPKSRKEVDSNALLIASAPELLEALESALGLLLTIRDDMRGIVSSSIQSSAANACKAAQAVIAKAKGQQ